MSRAGDGRAAARGGTSPSNGPPDTRIRPRARPRRYKRRGRARARPALRRPVRLVARLHRRARRRGRGRGHLWRARDLGHQELCARTCGVIGARAAAARRARRLGRLDSPLRLAHARVELIRQRSRPFAPQSEQALQLGAGVQRGLHGRHDKPRALASPTRLLLRLPLSGERGSSEGAMPPPPQLQQRISALASPTPLLLRLPLSGERGSEGPSLPGGGRVSSDATAAAAAADLLELLHLIFDNE
jgi:hypothetical protein